MRVGEPWGPVWPRPQPRFRTAEFILSGIHQLQREMALRNDGIAKERRIEFRIGINLGDIVIAKHDIYGHVDVAARLEALAEPGGICVSRVVRDQVRDRLDFGLRISASGRSRTSQGRSGSTRSIAGFHPACGRDDRSPIGGASGVAVA